MRILFLLAAISIPALAAPVPIKTFGKWKVFNINGVLTATSKAKHPSKYTLTVSCNSKYHNCYMQYVQPNACDSSRHRYIKWKNSASKAIYSFEVECQNGQWTDASFYENSVPIWLRDKNETFRVGFADDKASFNTYNTNGALHAMRYIWANKNNFNQR